MKLKPLTILAILVNILISCNGYYPLPEQEEPFNMDVVAFEGGAKLPIQITVNKDAELTYMLAKGDGYLIIDGKEIKEVTHSFLLKRGTKTIAFVSKSYKPIKILIEAKAEEKKLQKELNINIQDMDLGWDIAGVPGSRRPKLYDSSFPVFVISGPQTSYQYKIETEGKALVRLHTDTSEDKYKRERTVLPGKIYKTPIENLKLSFYYIPLETGSHSLKLIVIDNQGNTISKKYLYDAQEAQMDNELKLAITHVNNESPNSYPDPYIYHLIDTEIGNSQTQALNYGISLRQLGEHTPYIPEESYRLTIEPASGTGLPKNFFKVAINDKLTLYGNSIDFDTFIFAARQDRQNAISVEVNQPEKYGPMNKKIKTEITLKSDSTGKVYTIFQTLRIQIDKKGNK